jgi:hypothetical protein
MAGKMEGIEGKYAGRGRQQLKGDAICSPCITMIL